MYLVLAADTLNEEAADALLKDLEEPPPYAVIVLVADDLGPLPETIRSRCQLVPFRRLSERAVRAEIAARAPGLGRRRRRRSRASRPGGSTAPSGCSTRRPRSAARRCSRSRAPSTPTRLRRPRRGAARSSTASRERGDEAKEHAEEELAALDLPTREAEQRVRRAAARRRAGGAARLARGARLVVPRPRRGRGRRGGGGRSTPIASTSCGRTRRASGSPAPSAAAETCARRGARSRSSTSPAAGARSALRPAPQGARRNPAAGLDRSRARFPARSPLAGVPVKGDP